MPNTHHNKVTHIDMYLAKRSADAEVGSFKPAHDLPEESLTIPTAAHITARREELKEKKEMKKRTRRFVGLVALGAVMLASGVTLASYNSESIPEKLPKGKIELEGIVLPNDEGGVSSTVKRTLNNYYRGFGDKATSAEIANETTRVVENELGGNSLVHGGDTFPVWAEKNPQLDDSIK